MPNNGYFNIKRDIEIVNAGGFFCEACIVGKPASEQSPDPRYCQSCYDLLLKEAELLDGKKPTWVPKDSQSITRTPLKPIRPASGVGHNYIGTQGTRQGSGIMSTVKTNNKRGPKHKPVPVDLVTQWAGEGMVSKAIAAKLKAEHGVTVSYKTIQRMLSGQRVLV